MVGKEVKMITRSDINYTGFINPNNDGKIQNIFNMGDDITIKIDDDASRRGVISKITKNGLYLDVGNKRDLYFKFKNIVDINRGEKS